MRSMRSLKAMAALCGLAFVALALAARSTAYLPFDPPVSRAVQSYETDWLHRVAEAISWLGFPPEVDILVGLLAVGLLLTGRRWEAAGVAVAGAGAGALYLLVVALVDQPRPSPDLVRVAASLPTSAFPSGHETVFTAVLGFCGYLGYAESRARLAGWLSVIGVVLFLLVLGWARLYQGQHWLSELLGGVCLGGFWLVVTINLYQRTSRRLG